VEKLPSSSPGVVSLLVADLNSSACDEVLLVTLLRPDFNPPLLNPGFANHALENAEPKALPISSVGRVNDPDLIRLADESAAKEAAEEAA
jgi:hypothetical protein